MAAEASSSAGMRLLCSYGGRLLPCGPDGALRYVGGVTRVLVLPRAAAFRDLAARLSEMMGGGAEVRAVRHRLADAGLEDVLVSVTCDEELAHMRDEYDRLRATRPTASFRVFVVASAAPGSGGDQRRRAAPGLPPLAPRVRRVQSEQALAARAQLHRRPAYPAPVRRVQSAQELAGASRVNPFIHHRGHQCRCACRRQDVCAPAPPPRPMRSVPYMPMNVNDVRSRSQDEPAPAVSAAATAKARSRAEDTMDMDMKGRAIWEFE